MTQQTVTVILEKANLQFESEQIERSINNVREVTGIEVGWFKFNNLIRYCFKSSSNTFWQ
jgi:hypothetical protein